MSSFKGRSSRSLSSSLTTSTYTYCCICMIHMYICIIYIYIYMYVYAHIYVLLMSLLLSLLCDGNDTSKVSRNLDDHALVSMVRGNPDKASSCFWTPLCRDRPNPQESIGRNPIRESRSSQCRSDLIASTSCRKAEDVCTLNKNNKFQQKP